MNAYERLRAARKSGRPTARKYIEALCDRFFELHGDRLFADDPAILARHCRAGRHARDRDRHRKGRRYQGENHPKLRLRPTRRATARRCA